MADEQSPPEDTKAGKGRRKPAEEKAPAVKLPSVNDHKAKLPAKQKFMHAAASALHGWHEHEHHEGSPLGVYPRFPRRSTAMPPLDS